MHVKIYSIILMILLLIGNAKSIDIKKSTESDTIKVIALHVNKLRKNYEKIQIEVFVFNQTHENITIKLSGLSADDSPNIFYKIEGNLYENLNDNLTVLGHVVETNSTIDGSIPIHIKARSAYKIPCLIEFDPFAVNRKHNIKASKNEFLIYNVSLTINSEMVKSNDLIIMNFDIKQNLFYR